MSTMMIMMTQQNREFKELFRDVVTIKQLVFQKLATKKRKASSKDISFVILTRLDDNEEISLSKRRVRNLKTRESRRDSVNDASNQITTMRNALKRNNTLARNVNKQSSKDESTQFKSRLKLAHYIEILFFNLLNFNQSFSILSSCKNSFSNSSINFNVFAASNTQNIFFLTKKQIFQYSDDSSLVASQKFISLTLSSFKSLCRIHSLTIRVEKSFSKTSIIKQSTRRRNVFHSTISNARDFKKKF